MGDDNVPQTKSWWSTLPGLLTALAAMITAITGLYLAIQPKSDPCKTLPFDERPISCLGADK
jgi:hypothetical protein